MNHIRPGWRYTLTILMMKLTTLWIMTKMILSGMTIATNDHYKSSDDISIAVMMRLKVGTIVMITMETV